MQCFPWFGDKIAEATQERILNACEEGSVGVVDLQQLKAFLSTADANTVEAAFRAVKTAIAGASHRCHGGPCCATCSSGAGTFYALTHGPRHAWLP